MRLGFAVATEADPDILLMDEIWRSGTRRFSKCLERIEDFHGRGKTIFMVSHAPASIRKFCQRALWIDEVCCARTGLRTGHARYDELCGSRWKPEAKAFGHPALIEYGS